MSATEALRADFFRVAVFDETLAVALQAQCDLAIEGDFKRALKLNQAIGRRLKLLAAVAATKPCRAAQCQCKAQKEAK